MRQREEGEQGEEFTHLIVGNTSLKERFTEKFNSVTNVSFPGQ